MSLVQHVSALEGVDREPDPDEDASLHPIRRKISYDVFPPPVIVSEELDKSGTPAYKVSRAWRCTQVFVTVAACWLASGIVFGFAALKPVLVAEGVYRELCTEEEVHLEVEVCSEQDLRLNLFFTIASITANVSALPVGHILDRYGSRVCGVAGCGCLAIGAILMAYSFASAGFDGYMIGNFFLALGGTFIFVPSFQIANAFPKRAGVIVALVTGAFDASAAVYLGYRLMYATSPRLFSPRNFFLGYLAVPVLILLGQLTVLPARDYQSMQQLEVKIEKAQDPRRDVHESDEEIDDFTQLRQVRRKRAERRQAKLQRLDNVLGDADERRLRGQQEEERQHVSGVWGILHGQPAHRQMASPWFLLITLMTVVQMVRMNYFIATIRAQYEYMLSSGASAAQINGLFDVALPAVGVLSTPVIGFLLDHLSVTVMLAAIVVLTTAVGVLNSIPLMGAGYATVIVFVFLRPLYYSAMSDYATKVFGFATFGRVYGTIICVSGLANFSQYGLDALTHGPFGGNPIPINAALAGISFLVGTVLVIFVHVEARKSKDDEGDSGERERLIDDIPDSILEEEM
ncbi:hypothetical protein ASPZODRAFT_148097 [Penicilliopsis zonata CBS 506.65]|uniref:Major facilitator superfamily (MFS) profile domain-containing protein n=1 Tax=Penicilliopsis zonata CBS 506.65 TaxID=1073090 RepID=A0A1L9SU23_9EURO|nr:hypothetical protein ASPZODRAFT_148097 [Penicilliopsis zonata CBS 506.65]OJJ50621.1 hypothetical protein ASPZODRAFT_148097 [Penicilliopsis zonata CBS 506.65]